MNTIPIYFIFLFLVKYTSSTSIYSLKNQYTKVRQAALLCTFK